MVLETINDFDVDCEEDEECGFPRDRNFTNQEILQHLNIEDDANGENDALRSEREEIVPCCISFDNLKPRMDDISGEGKVIIKKYTLLYYCCFILIRLIISAGVQAGETTWGWGSSP